MRPGSLFNQTAAPGAAEAGGAMDPITGGIIAGGASIIGGLINADAQGTANRISQENVNNTNQMNRENMQAQMKYQTDMSNTSYQRGVEDLKKAGLNPMLAYAQGGASTPPGASANMVAAKVESTRPGDAIESGIGSAIEHVRLKKELNQADSGIELNKANEEAAKATAIMNMNSAKLKQQEQEIVKAQMPAIKARAKADTEQAVWDSKMMNVDNVGKRLGGVIGAAKDAAMTYGAIKHGGAADAFRLRKNEVPMNSKTGEIRNTPR